METKQDSQQVRVPLPLKPYVVKLIRLWKVECAQRQLEEIYAATTFEEAIAALTEDEAIAS